MTAEDAALLGAPRAGQVEALTVRHMAGGAPFVLEERLINLAVAPSAADEPFEDAPPGTWLLQLVPWTDAEHIIRAEAASAFVAGQLSVPPRSACLVVERRTWQGGATITFVKLTYPGERHQLTSRFSPGDRI